LRRWQHSGLVASRSGLITGRLALPNRKFGNISSDHGKMREDCYVAAHVSRSLTTSADPVFLLTI